jgi:hypothetical protein
MAGFATFDDMVALVLDYAHRPNLENQVRDFFIPLASRRIGRDLRSRHNLTNIGLPTAQPIVLPADFAAVRSIWWQQGQNTIALGARDDRTFTLLPVSGGQPCTYLIRGGELAIRPFVSGQVLLSYWTIPELDSIVTTNEVLLAYPQLYLYAALVELQVWAQDATQRDQAVATYTGELRTINRAESRSSADAPQSIGA